MKVFATLATILGVSYASSDAQIHHLGHMGSMRSIIQQQNNVIRTPADNAMSGLRMVTPQQAQTDPNQYHLQDEFGNYEYAFKNQDSEKMEKGNVMSVRGRYAYIMSDGTLRRVDYIADKNGFHILQDNADNSRAQERNKRSVEPDLIKTRMTSLMDSSSIRDDSTVNPHIYNIMGRDMSDNLMLNNKMATNLKMYSMTDMSPNMMKNVLMNHNMMNQNVMDSNMVNLNQMGHKMYSNDMSSNMMNRDMLNHKMMDRDMLNQKMMGQDISSKMMGNTMYSKMMDLDMSSNMMGQGMLNSNMMGQDLSSNLMGHNLYSKVMGRDMSSNLMNTNIAEQEIKRPSLGQHSTMSQRMEIEHIPQAIGSNRFF